MTDDQEHDVDEAAEALIRAEKTRRALTLAPDLAEHLRTLVLHSDGRTESGVAVTVERTPLIAAAADSADELYVILLEWVAYWSETLNLKPPMTARSAWGAAWTTAGGLRREGPDVAAGFRAGTTPERASALVWSLAFWLLVNDAEISAHPTAATYQDEISRTVWALRAGSRLSNAPVRTTSPRPCPVCGEHTVHGEFFGGSIDRAEKDGERLRAWARPGDEETPEQALHQFLRAVAGVEVRCEYCGWTADARPSQIARWLA